MDKLLKKYNEECSCMSKGCNRVWKIGQVILVIIFTMFLTAYSKNMLMSFVTFIIFIIVSAFFVLFCEVWSITNMENKLKIKHKPSKAIFNRKYREKIYSMLDEFQKGWITKYCKDNKLNSIHKLEILREEINGKNDGNIKYINPIVIATLALTIWEIIIGNLYDNLGISVTIIGGVFLVLIVSFVVGFIRKGIKEQSEFMNLFSKYAGYERLSELLLYEILKCK